MAVGRVGGGGGRRGGGTAGAARGPGGGQWWWERQRFVDWQWQHGLQVERNTSIVTGRGSGGNLLLPQAPEAGSGSLYARLYQAMRWSEEPADLEVDEDDD